MDSQRPNSPERVVEMGKVWPLEKDEPKYGRWGRGRSDQWELRPGAGCC